jgi:hypothetical protein
MLYLTTRNMKTLPHKGVGDEKSLTNLFLDALRFAFKELEHLRLLSKPIFTYGKVRPKMMPHERLEKVIKINIAVHTNMGTVVSRINCFIHVDESSVQYYVPTFMRVGFNNNKADFAVSS